MNGKNIILTHAIKAIEYRFRKAIAGAKDNFGNFKISDHTRSPNEIINHMFDLSTKTKSLIMEGHFNCPPPEILDFAQECKRFLIELKELQMVMKDYDIDIEICKKLLQGPVLDIATHVGQIAMLNGLNGNKVSKENYYSAELE